MLTCKVCKTEFERRPGPGRHAYYCGDGCRSEALREGNRARLREWQRGRSQPPRSSRIVPCAGGCGGTVYISRSSLPAGQATCRPCRSSGLGTRKGAAPKREVACCSCGTPVSRYSYWCYPCSVANRVPGKGRDLEKRRALNIRRRERLRAAPGVSQYARYALLAKWKRQGRSCTYCPSLATSLDHVIPVALGGTNLEGNLTPACLPCNGSKNDSLLIEWKYDRRADHERVIPEPVVQVAVPQAISIKFPAFRRCEFCARLTLRRGRKRFCSERCGSVVRSRRGKPSVHHCTDCNAEIGLRRNKCDECVRATKRASKREYKRRLKARVQVGSNHGKEYTGPELKIVADCTRSVAEVARELGRTPNSVRKVRRRLGLSLVLLAA